MRYILIGISCLLQVVAIAQHKYTINGYVKDSVNGESIIGAIINVNSSNRTVNTNQYGFFSITLEEGDYTLTISHTSYISKQVQLSLYKNEQLDLFLYSRSAAMNEVIVYSRRKDANIQDAQMGKIDLTMNQLKGVPSLMGEVDLLKSVQLLPGVRNAGDVSSGLYIRGGGPDQNLILLDDAVVYNTGHLFGLFSIFNSDAIKNVTLVKGGMPAQYGGRLSSVLDVSMKDGSNRSFAAEGGIGIIASRLSLQGPIKKNKSSFIISGRRTYFDALTKPFIKKQSDLYGSRYYFYDLNAKANFQISSKDRVFVSGYFGRDIFQYRDAKRSFKADIPWGNATASFRWNHVFNPKLFANTTAIYNDYNFKFAAAQNNFELSLASGIRDVGVKVDFDYYPSVQHRVKFGGQTTLHKFVPNVLTGRQDSVIFNPSTEDIKYALESGIYVQDDWDINERVKLNAGLRWSSFMQIGPYTRYLRDENENKVDSITYKTFRKVQQYNGFEPRLTVRYILNESTSLKASVARNLQYIHLVSNAGTTLPTDLWVPSTYVVQPQKSWHYAAGVFKNFKNNAYETSLEVYYKDMRNQIEYKEGYTPSMKDPELDFVFGRGWSYGAELFINKVRGRFTGWIGYTVSWTWRRFSPLNNGEKFPAKYDRRHDLSVVGTLELNPQWKFGSVFVYGTGNTISLPVRFYFVEGVLTQEFSKVNQYRLPPYHRLDISATYTPKPYKKKRVQSSWVFGIYNVYSRFNPYFVYFNHEGSAPGGVKITARKVSVFPIMPSVTWNFKW